MVQVHALLKRRGKTMATTTYFGPFTTVLLIIVCSHLYLHQLEALQFPLPNIRLHKHNSQVIQGKCSCLQPLDSSVYIDLLSFNPLKLLYIVLKIHRLITSMKGSFAKAMIAAENILQAISLRKRRLPLVGVLTTLS